MLPPTLMVIAALRPKRKAIHRRRSSSRVLVLLRRSGPLAPKEIASRLNARRGTARQWLRRLRLAGLVVRQKNGKYKFTASRADYRRVTKPKS